MTKVDEKVMTDQQIRQWIEACNHEPARAALRHYLVLREAAKPPTPEPAGDVRKASTRKDGITSLEEMRADRDQWRELARLEADRAALSAPASVKAAPGSGVVAWIANDPEGGPYLTWSAEAAANYPSPTALYASPAPPQQGETT